MRYSVTKALLCAVSILLCCHCKTAYQSTVAAVEVPPECEEFKALVLAEWKEKRSQEGKYYQMGDSLTSFIQLNGVSRCFQSLDTTRLKLILGSPSISDAPIFAYFLDKRCILYKSPCSWLNIEYNPTNGMVNRIQIQKMNWTD